MKKMVRTRVSKILTDHTSTALDIVHSSHVHTTRTRNVIRNVTNSNKENVTAYMTVPRL